MKKNYLRNHLRKKKWRPRWDVHSCAAVCGENLGSSACQVADTVRGIYFLRRLPNFTGMVVRGQVPCRWWRARVCFHILHDMYADSRL